MANNMSIDKVIEIVEQAAIYSPVTGESIRIDYWDTPDEDPQEMFYGTGEESGEEYGIRFDEVDLELDLFYKLVLINPKD